MASEIHLVLPSNSSMVTHQNNTLAHYIIYQLPTTSRKLSGDWECGLNSIRLALRYDDLLEFRFVERRPLPFNLSPCQSTKRYTGASDRCASTIVNSSSVQFAMYPFSKCRFALLMRTRSPTLNLGVPTVS